jgi:hypothetical protein
MSFYAFSLDVIDVVFQRGKITDVDVITFSILVNQQLRARAAGTGIGNTGFPIVLSTVGIAQRFGPIVRGGKFEGNVFGWLAGPFSLAPGDAVRILYSGTNTSDSELGDDQVAKIEIQILDQLLTAGTAAVAGALAGDINKALSFIGDPVGTILGFKPEGPCNGSVFSDGLDFPGDSLANLPFDQQADGNFVPDGTDSSSTGAKATVFTKPDTGTYTDAATHNTDICGRPAETTVKFTIYRLDRGVSLRAYGGKRFGLPALQQGIRKLGTPPFTVRQLLQLNQ